VFMFWSSLRLELKFEIRNQKSEEFDARDAR